MQWQKFTEDHPDSLRVSEELMGAYVEVARRAPHDAEAAIPGRPGKRRTGARYLPPRLRVARLLPAAVAALANVRAVIDSLDASRAKPFPRASLLGYRRCQISRSRDPTRVSIGPPQGLPFVRAQ